MVTGRLVAGLLVLCVSLGVLALVAIHSSMPSPRRALSPPPERPGTTYRCHCWNRSLRVWIEAPAEPDPPRRSSRPARGARRGRHARPRAAPGRAEPP